MSLMSSKRLFSLLIVPLLIVMVGCGGKSGGTAVVVPDFDSGLISDGSFEFGSDAWTGNATNLVPEEGNPSNTVNFADIAVAGNPFDVNLSQVVPITQGKRYTLTFRGRTELVAEARSEENVAARTAETRTIIAGIGLNEAPFLTATKEITLTIDWQTFTLTLDASAFGIENSRILFDMGADTGPVILDDVVLEEIGDIPPPPAFEGGSLINGDFESDGAWIGNAFNIEEIDGNRVNSANIETAGNPFDVNLSQVVAIEQGKTFKLTFKARTDEARTLLAGIGLNEGDFVNDSKEVNLTPEWQTFELTLSSAAFGSANSRVLFDMGADTGLVLIDDVLLEEISGTGGDSGVDTGSFDDGLLTNGSFENGTSSWTGNAASVSEELLGFNGSKANFANVETAGNPFDVNLSQAVSIVQGETYTLTFKAKSDGERTMLAGIGLNVEPFTNNAQSVDLTTDWRTFTLTLPATDFGGANSRVLFDMGADTGVVIIDEVKLEGPAGEDTPVEPVTPPVIPPVNPPVIGCNTSGIFDDGLLTNGNFEAGVSSWIGNAANVTDELLGCDGSKANFANVETLPANVFDVNLSQVVALTTGELYTLTFKAKSDRNRTLIAGIGLNEGDFANNSRTVDLTPDWQTFTLTLLADGFGSTNSRVLFDMGAALGVVIIDEVSLVQVGGTTPPPTPPVVPPAVTLNISDAFRDATATSLSISGTPEVAGDGGNAFVAVSSSTTALEGSSSMQFDYTGGAWGGVFTNFDAPVDAGTPASVSVALLSDVTLSSFNIKLEDGTNNGEVNIISYPSTASGAWTVYTIPAADFGSVDLSALTNIGFWHPLVGGAPATSASILIDDVTFVGTATPPPPPVTALNISDAFRDATATSLSISGTPEVAGDGGNAFVAVSSSTTALEGSSSMQFDYTGGAWGGVFTNFDAPVDAGTPASVSVALLSDVTLSSFNIKLEDGTNNGEVNIISYPSTASGAWTVYTIPAADFGSVDLSALTNIGFWHPLVGGAPATSASILIDDVTFVGTATPPPAPTAATGELTTNGGFETGDFTGTEQFANGGVQTISNVNPKTGTSSAKLFVANSNNDTVLKFANLAPGGFTPGQTINVSFDMRGTLGPGGVGFAEFFSELSGGGVSKAEILFNNAPIFPNADPNLWTSFSTTVTTGNDTSGGVTLQLKVASGASTNAELFFDNVSVSIP